MRTYSVLLVDDEEPVYEVIMKKLNWAELGFRIEGYARNGVEALEMAEELQPDVVMTDIKMPYMDGLTLCKQLKERNPGIKVIIFSGFDEFEFAKEAIKIEAEEYILKPIDADELSSVFEQIHVALDKEIDEKRNIDKLQEYYMNSLPMLQENFYISLIEGRMPENTIHKYASDYQISFEGPFYAVAVLSISYSSKNGEEMEVAPFLLQMSVRQLTEEYLTPKGHMRTLSYIGDIVVVAQITDEKGYYAFTDDCDRLCKMAKRICKANVTAGIGYLCDEPYHIRESYQSAKAALSYRVLYGNMRAINATEVGEEEGTKESHLKDEAIRNILRSMKLNEKEQLPMAVDSFMEGLTEAKLSITDFRVILMKLVVELTDFMANYQLSMADVMESENEDLLQVLLQQESSEALGEKLTTYCTRIRRLMNERRKDSTQSFVAKAVEYVADYYANQEIGIDSVCSYLNVSSAYFSTAFKKETGKTFINYLTEYRMEKAVELLTKSDEKTYIIAEKVGYADPNYFSYVFKKQFGVSPSKYRSSQEEG